MPKALRYGLIIVAIAMVLYLVARNLDDVIYSFGQAFFETKEQEERAEDVFGAIAVQGESEAGAVNFRARYHMPPVFQMLGMPETYDLVAESVMTVSDQDEFIHNADFAADLIGRAAGALDIKDKVMEPLQKLMNFVSKIFR